MQHSIRRRRQSHTMMSQGLTAVFMAAVAFPLAAFAGLGGPSESVKNDQCQMKAVLKTTVLEAYTIHELTSPQGTVVREYVSPSGRVFAVSWEGPFIPDMKQLLAAYFDEYSRVAKEQRAQRVGRSPLNIHGPSLVIQSAGHMRSYFGRAYDPALLPAGVSADELR